MRLSLSKKPSRREVTEPPGRRTRPLKTPAPADAGAVRMTQLDNDRTRRTGRTVSTPSAALVRVQLPHARRGVGAGEVLVEPTRRLPLVPLKQVPVAIDHVRARVADV